MKIEIEVPDNLMQRCIEIQEWRRVGVIKGKVLRSYAKEHFPDDPHPVHRAERATEKELMELVLAAKFGNSR